MEQLDVTRMSAKGQVVIPGDIRQALALEPGTKFVVVAEGDTVILKRIGRPMMAEVDQLFSESRRFAKRVGLKRSDVRKAVQKARGR
jgi:antitoxin PrlF